MKKIIIYIYNLILSYSIFLLKKKKTKQKRDIVIVKVDGIGDFFIWLNTLKYYQKIYLNRQIDLVCNEQVEKIAKELNYFSKIIPINRQKFYENYRYKLKIMENLNRYEYDILLSPTFSREIFCLDWIVNFIKSKEKIGFLGDNTNTGKFLKKISDKYYTKLIISKHRNLNELERDYEFLENLSPKIKIKKRINSINKNFNLNKKIDGLYCMLFIGSSNPKKNWDINKFIEISKMIPQNYKIVLSGGKNEKKLGEYFMSNFPYKDKIINMINKTDLLETLSLIKNSKFIIGNDTGAIHMAVYCKTKAICIINKANLGRFLPYKDTFFQDKNLNPKIITNKIGENINEIEVKDAEKVLTKLLMENENGRVDNYSSLKIK